MMSNALCTGLSPCRFQARLCSAAQAKAQNALDAAEFAGRLSADLHERMPLTRNKRSCVVENPDEIDPHSVGWQMQLRIHFTVLQMLNSNSVTVSWFREGHEDGCVSCLLN